jgi:hypothetical protein
MALNIKYRQIKAFIDLAETRSFTSAADRLSVTQPSLSTLLKELEQDLDSPPSSATLVEHFRPFIELCIDVFGAKRCMFESNFPVDRGMCSYTVLWNAFKKLSASCSEEEKAQLFEETALGVYRLESF